MVNMGELFYGALPLLHAIGAILALSLSFACDTGRAKQSARVPYRLPLPSSNFSFSADRAFLAAYPWDEGGEFVTHEWNPFALIFVFEWLTAGFALRPLMYYTTSNIRLLQVHPSPRACTCPHADTPHRPQVWVAWLAVGVAMFILWTILNSGGAHVAMLCTVLASFALSGVIGYLSLYEDTPGLNKPMMAQKKKGDFQVLQGRVWWVPHSVAGLRYRGVAAESVDDYPQFDLELENLYGVILRYLEYCITAPLLFLAVVCLMVVDAPAWLFLTGYWLLVTCNAVGIAIHVSFWNHEKDSALKDSGGFPGFITRLFFANPW